MNDTTLQGDGKVAYVPVVVNAKPPKPSNADRIRSMTDEELDKFVSGDGLLRVAVQRHARLHRRAMLCETAQLAATGGQRCLTVYTVCYA